MANMAAALGLDQRASEHYPTVLNPAVGSYLYLLLLPTIALTFSSTTKGLKMEERFLLTTAETHCSTNATQAGLYEPVNVFH